jgi:SAM-dependent methyltransferase
MRLVRIKYGEWKADLVRSHSEGMCLDLGCRNRLYEKDFRGEYVGVDISRGNPPPDIICDAEHLPFRPRIFETIVAFDVLEHLDHPERSLLEISTALIEGGSFLATTPNAMSPSSWWDFTHRQHFTRRTLTPLIGDVFEEFNIFGTGYPTLKFAWLRSLASMVGYVDSFVIVAKKVRTK